MDHEEPSLPPVSSDWRPPRPTLLTRKRTYDQSLYDGEPLTATSSDPALFSGDERESVGAENYSSRRKKKMYTGSWYHHQMKAGKGDRKKEFKRNYDSGIFMGSDSEPPSSDSFTSLDDELIRDQATKANPLSMLGQHLEEDQVPTPRGKTSHAQREDLDSTPRHKFVAKQDDEDEPLHNKSPAKLNQQQGVVRTIRKCFDEGRETVDLSGLSLLELPAEIRELAYLTKQANFVSGMLDNGTSLETHLRLFLGNNFLRQLPRPVLDLTNLRELSLRRNKLTKLPAGIRNLVNLEKLNVSGNKLTSIPFEVIDLMQNHNLRELSTLPNLWEVPESIKMAVKGHIWKDRLSNTAIAAESVPEEFAKALVRHTGRLLIIPPDIGTTRESPVPSLTDMILQQLNRFRPIDDLRDYMPPSTSVNVLSALSELNDAIQEGDRQCNSCHRSIVRPECSWIEWWMADSTCVAVNRMACGRKCALAIMGEDAAS